ncbi:uncharacterized protein UBRO_20652-A [Ustilago bromivora]|uniref:Uncharacterized protein n=1 Tax=Ustilago bromivora TaxID=307758 RepID=A0A1K0GQD5_9BASI|nr:uncharacterized protein UBRO_20652-A [Ustilago bromivora]
MRLDLFGFRRAPIANTMNERRPEQTVLHCTSTASTQELRKRSHFLPLVSCSHDLREEMFPGAVQIHWTQ